jgi:hypothetical protein
MIYPYSHYLYFHHLFISLYICLSKHGPLVNVARFAKCKLFIKFNHLAALYFTISPKTGFDSSFFAPFITLSPEIL